jgi:nickel/cobalt exporter
MTPLVDLLRQGASRAWLFVPSAILLGALHGLEPGHSKTMMAAFIIGVRGTVGQAVLLGLAATVSHTFIVWAVALLGLHYASQFGTATIEPYLQLVSAILIIGIAIWMIWRTWREQRPAASEAHDHHHGEAMRRIDIGRGVVVLEVFEDGVPPRWRLRAESGHGWPASGAMLTTVRADGTEQTFSFVARDGFLESVEEILEPHASTVRLGLGDGDHRHCYDVAFTDRDHDDGDPGRGLDVTDGTAHDAHERAHANDIRRRFASRHVTTGQIVMFGLTGGLVPCPAAITVLLLCLQLQQFTLGVALVLCFSIGLALTMVTAGVIAALSVRHVSRRWSGFGAIAARAPYFSGVVIIGVGLYVGWQGLAALHASGII